MNGWTAALYKIRASLAEQGFDEDQLKEIDASHDEKIEKAFAAKKALFQKSQNCMNIFTQIN